MASKVDHKQLSDESIPTRPEANHDSPGPVPTIVIVGRPNVGKSSLLNLLAGRRVSIVDSMAGVTRDRVSAMIELPGSDGPSFAQLIDTGGYGLAEVGSGLQLEVERQICRALVGADLVLFVVDAQAGLTPLDQTVSRLIRSVGSRCPVLLVANKVDGDEWVADGWETAQLGFGEPVLVSTTTSYNKQVLRQRLAGQLQVSSSTGSIAEQPDSGVLLAVVGKRNAGKSTLVNGLVGDERVIISEQEGTTRDSVDVLFQHQGYRFTAIDTAGVRKRKSIKTGLEFYSLHRALRSIRRCDVCLMLIDSAVPIGQVDRQLVKEILKHHRPTVLVVNKWDLAESEHTEEEYGRYLDQQLKVLNFAPIVFISAVQREGLRELLAMALNLHEQAQHRVPTAALNEVIQGILTERGPRAKGGRRAKIYYATQLSTAPPTIGLFVNDPVLFDGNYQRFLINRLRNELPFSEVPIKLLIRGKERRRRV